MLLHDVRIHCMPEEDYSILYDRGTQLRRLQLPRPAQC
jgi:hypothetical protein